MSTVRRNTTTNTNPPERLPLRWGVIGGAAIAAGAVAFAVGGPLVAIGTACLTLTTLHKVLA
jgi:hypothetical protein